MKRILLFAILSLFSLPLFSQHKAEREAGFIYSDRMRIYDSVMASRIPQVNVLPGMLKTSLPDIVNNSQNLFFPGILDQYSFFSCQQYSGVGYTYAYEVNRLRNLPGNLPETRYSSHYTWNLMNDGERFTGVSYFYSWDVIRQQGIPVISDFGIDTASQFTGWMSGYQKYFNGMHNRLKSISSIPVNTEEGVLTLKNWLFDHLDGSPSGGVACFSASSNFQDNMAIIPPGQPEEGKNVLTAFYPSATHGMTVVGYNDSVRYDINQDGQYTNNIDINGDGIIDMKDHETGAWIIANSYGTWWADQGFFYALYRALALDYDDGTGAWTANNGVWNHSVYVVEADPDYTPLLTAKVNLTYNLRDKLRITAGISTDSGQQIPRFIQEFPLFCFQGGDLPMKGFNDSPSDRELEFGLDITPLLTYAEPGKPCRIFLNVEERDPVHVGNGIINHVSFIDYTSGINETSSTQTDVPIQDNSTTFIPAVATINFDKARVTTGSLPAYVPGEDYQYSLSASGGMVPYQWSLLRPLIKEETGNAFPMVSSTVLHPFSTYIPYASLALPFHFPFQGKYYDTVYVNAYGFISFDTQMLPYPYLTDEEGMIRRNKVISPAFTMNFLVNPQVNQVWAESLPESVTIRWKLKDMDHEYTSDNNFALRLHSDGSFEFLYGNISNTEVSLVTRSGFSAGDENNFNTWSNWDFDALAGKSFIFRPSELPDSINIDADGILQVSGADPATIYELPVRVTDALGISSEKKLDFSTGLQILYEIVSQDGNLTYGQPASLRLRVSNKTQETIHDLVLTLSSPDTSVSITDSLKLISSLDPGSDIEIDTAFLFDLSARLPDQYLLPFSIAASCPGHSWIKNFTLPVSSFMVEVASPVIADGYDGLLDPGEVANLEFRLNNLGSQGIEGINIHLAPQDTLVSILSSPDLVIGHLASYSSANIEFQVKASKHASSGQPAELILSLEKLPDLEMEVPVHLQLGKIPVAVINMSTASETPVKMEHVMDSLNVIYHTVDSIPLDLDSYAAVFLILGTVNPGSHELTQQEGQELASYLSKHGNLYLESYHTWYFGEQTEVHPYFKYTSERVPLFRYKQVNGLDSTFGEGMSFPFTGSWNFSLFNFLPVSPAYAVFSNSGGQPLEIANPDTSYKTIGTYVEFGKLADSTGISTKGNLMKEYLKFFGIGLANLHPLFHTDKNQVHLNEPVAFFDDSFDNILSWQWEFPGGDPAVSTEQNPEVRYHDFGKFDVKLTISDGVNSASILKKGFISVVPGLGTSEQAEQDWFTVYPNPSGGRIHLAISGSVGPKLSVQVFDLAGRIVYQKDLPGFNGPYNLPLDLSRTGKGVYILRVTTGTKSGSSLVILR